MQHSAQPATLPVPAAPATAPQTAGPVAGEAPTGDEQRATTAGMRLLSAGVPLSLLLDLSLPVDSRAISAAEGGSASWLGA